MPICLSKKTPADTSKERARYRAGDAHHHPKSHHRGQGQKGAANLKPVSINEQSLAEIEILKATQKEAFQRRACVPSRRQIKPGKREMQLQEGDYEKSESNPTSRSLYVS